MSVSIKNASHEELLCLKDEISAKYREYKNKGLKLDMSRGKPGADQLDLSNDMLKCCLDGDVFTESGFDCRNYGILDGIPEAKKLFMPMLGVSEKELIIGGNSSLQLMYDAISKAMLLGVQGGKKPWKDSNCVKFLCPVPGYDRHFGICENLGIEMINVPMNDDLSGPAMDMIEKLVSSDENIKGIWCVPMYSNPDGISYSDEVVRRFAVLEPKSTEFRIFWDNAYCVHHLCDEPDSILNIIDECKKTGKEDMVYVFASTSKISFPGAGISVMATSEANIKFILSQMTYQTIGFDKLNQLRHVKFFKDYDGILEQMKKHRTILEPKFNCVLEILEREIAPHKIGNWHKPKGGYFVSFNGMNGTAKRTVELCKEAGVIMTGAGATFPYGKDPCDKNIRIAPTFPPIDELRIAMEIFCLSVRLACVEVMLAE